MKIRADQLQAGQTFRSTLYKGIGIRTCFGTRVRQQPGLKTIVIDCGVGCAPVELVPSDELEILEGK